MRYSGKYLKFLVNANKFNFFYATKKTRGVKVVRNRMIKVVKNGALGLRVKCRKNDIGVTPNLSYIITDKREDIRYTVGGSSIGLSYARQSTNVNVSYFNVLFTSYYKDVLLDNSVEITARLLSAIHSYSNDSTVKLVLGTVKVDPSSCSIFNFESPVNYALEYFCIDKAKRTTSLRVIPIMDSSRYKKLLADAIPESTGGVLCDTSEPNITYLEIKHYSYMSTEEIDKEVKLLLSNNAII